MNGKFLTLSIPSPFVLRLSKDERRVFQQNRNLKSVPSINSGQALSCVEGSKIGRGYLVEIYESRIEVSPSCEGEAFAAQAQL